MAIWQFLATLISALESTAGKAHLALAISSTTTQVFPDLTDHLFYSFLDLKHNDLIISKCSFPYAVCENVRLLLSWDMIYQKI